MSCISYVNNTHMYAEQDEIITEFDPLYFRLSLAKCHRDH